MGTHDDLVPVGINMALAERNWLRENIVTRAEQVDKENFMVLDQTKDALVVVARALRAERNDNSLGGVSLDDALSHGERVHVALIGEKLERSRQVAIVHHV